MAKTIYCANCGMELSIIIKAIPSQQITLHLIEPHTCPDEDPTLPFKDSNNIPIPKPKSGSSKTLDKAFEDFKFVKKINDLNESKPNNPLIPNAPSDKRPKEDRFDKLSAPSGVLSAVKSRGLSLDKKD